MKHSQENVIFLKSLLKAPLKMGAFLPSSKGLAEMVSRHVCAPDNGGYILEIGAGTGSLTKAILNRGVCSSQLLVLEMQPVLANFLRNLFPDISVIEGDAKNLPFILPEHVIGKVHTIVSGIPMVNLKFQDQLAIIEACKQVLMPSGSIIQFTYRPGSPLSCEKFGMRKKYLGSVLRNIPPASVWEYSFKDKFDYVEQPNHFKLKWGA
jgi:phosphatidylethanolamine/phosphatidyl-N-methylethanolamine N-methyltransferase